MKDVSVDGMEAFFKNIHGSYAATKQDGGHSTGASWMIMKGLSTTSTLIIMIIFCSLGSFCFIVLKIEPSLSCDDVVAGPDARLQGGGRPVLPLGPG